MLTAFISHAHADSDTAAALAQRLTARGISVLQPATSFTPGEPWAAQLQHIVRSSDLFFILVSRASTSSDAVSTEAAWALYGHSTTRASTSSDLYSTKPTWDLPERGPRKVRIVPVLVEKDVEIPFFLRRLQSLDLSHPENVERQLDLLVDASGPESEPLDIANEYSPEVESILIARENLISEMETAFEYRVIWSSTIKASLFAALILAATLALATTVLTLVGGSYTIHKWLLAFGGGSLSGISGSLLFYWIRNRYTSRNASVVTPQ